MRLSKWPFCTLWLLNLARAAAISRRGGPLIYPGSCNAVNLLVSSVNMQDAVNSYCSDYLGIVTKIQTVTTTSTLITGQQTTAAYTTTTSVITPPPQVLSYRQKVTISTTSTRNASTVTTTVTSTAYLDPDGNTITEYKRSLPTPPPGIDVRGVYEERGFPIPAIFSGWDRPHRSSACDCQGIATPTRTRSVISYTSAASTRTLNRIIRKTTSIPTQTTSSTLVSTASVLYIAPGPIIIDNEVTLITIYGCPAVATTIFTCPEGTGNDDGSLASMDELACSVLADDGYFGYCAYYLDDGQPAPSILILYDPNHPGDPAYASERTATYGDPASSDCPAVADWACLF